MKRLVIYIHGKGGSAAEAGHYRTLFPDCEVIGAEYRSQTPREAREELPRLFDRLAGGYDSVVLIANSIGAYFALQALSEKNIDRAYLISPVVDMERLILRMLRQAGKTEAELREQGELCTGSSERLSWEYLSDVREHPISWSIPTVILYGSRDSIVPLEDISAFAERSGAELAVMENGEHWFHTPEQMRFLDERILEREKLCNAPDTDV